MKSNILLSTALSFSLGMNSASADDNVILSKPSQTLENVKTIISKELKPVLNDNLTQIIQELNDKEPTELIEDPKSSVDHLVSHDYQQNTQLVDLNDIDSGPKVKRVIKFKLRSVRPAKKEFKKSN